MDKLPSLILERILHYRAPLVTDDFIRYGPEIARLASTCRAFQLVLERSTFRAIHLDKARVTEAAAILLRYPHRIKCLKSIRFTAKLPAYDEDACKRFQSPAETLTNSRIFTENTVALFDFLCSIKTAFPSQDLSLDIRAQSPTDVIEYDPQYSKSIRPTFGHPIPGDFQEWHYRNHPVSLLYRPVRSLMSGFPFIGTLWLRGIDYARHIEPETMGWITTVFNNLSRVEWDFWDCDKEDLELRRMNRSKLANAITLLRPSVKDLTLWCEYFPPGNQEFDPPTTLMFDETEDRVTKAIRQASQNFERLELKGVLGSPQLFWPKHPGSERDLPFWPHLQELIIQYHIVTPEGEWLFEEDATPNPRHTHYGYMYHQSDEFIPDEEWPPNQFRYSPTQDLLDELYLAAAYAVARMPRLRTLLLMSTNFGRGELISTDVHDFHFEVKGRIGTATWSGSPIFIPSDEVIKAWQEAANKLNIHLVTRFKENMDLDIRRRDSDSDSDSDDDGEHDDEDDGEDESEVDSEEGSEEGSEDGSEEGG